MVLFIPFQFSVMDGWQRCVAAGGEEKIVRPGMLWGGILVGLAFMVPVLLGISVGNEIQDPINALLLIINKVPSEALYGLAIAGILVCFLSSLFSTADTLLLNASYSLVYDQHVGRKDPQLTQKEFGESSSVVPTLRAWTVILGLGSMLMFGLLFVVPLSAFILATLSSQAILGILVLYNIFFGKGTLAKNREPGARWSIITGFVFSIVFVAYGLVTSDQQIIDGAPFLAVIIAIGVFFLVPKTKVNNEKNNKN